MLIFEPEATLAVNGVWIMGGIAEERFLDSFMNDMLWNW